MSTKPLSRAREDIEELRAYGYTVRSFTPWHYRVSHPDYAFSFDLWPSQRKYRMHDGNGKATHYRDILDIHDAFLDKS